MKSMRFQLTWWLVTTTIVLVLIASVALYVYVRLALFKEFDAGLYARAQGLAALLRIESDGRYDLDLSDQSLPEYLPGRRQEYFQVFVNGKLLEKSRSLKDRLLQIPSDSLTSRTVWNLVLPNSRSGRALGILAKPQPEDEDKPSIAQLAANAPSALVVVARDRADLDHILNTLLSSLIVASAVLAATCFAAVQLIIRYALRPVDRLAAQAAAMGPETLGDRFRSDELPHELKPISIRLNDLLDRLSSAFQRQRRLNSDIAHELRTPIAELRTLTEIALKWPADSTTTAGYFGDAYDISRKLESIVEMLLALARSQTQQVSISFAKINLSEAVSTILQSHDEIIRSKNFTVDCAIPAIMVSSDRFIFTRIVQNLLANAVEYTPQNGSIAILGEQTNNSCKLSIRNSNDSISTEDLPRLFESFWRKDASRSDRSHAGLGLTLVSEYAKHLNIKIEARLPASDQLELILWLPANQPGHLPVMLAADNPLPPPPRRTDHDFASAQHR
jgi:signal transduction histidine kinase